MAEGKGRNQKLNKQTKMNYLKYIKPFITAYPQFETPKAWKEKLDEADESYWDYKETGLMKEVDEKIDYCVKEGFVDKSQIVLMTYDERDDWIERAEAKAEMSEEEKRESYGPDYPLGGTLEPYDIWREKQMGEELEKESKD